MFKLLDTVVLTRDVPDAGLRRGDLGAIVEVYGPNAFEVEFVAASGPTQVHIRAYGSKMLENQVFDVVGHGNDPPRRAF